jgi:hypothetical protein
MLERVERFMCEWTGVWVENERGRVGVKGAPPDVEDEAAGFHQSVLGVATLPGVPQLRAAILSEDT